MLGFDWKEYAAAIPSPLVVVVTYKDNKKTNATMQSLLTFLNSNGFYRIFADVNKCGHMYTSIKERNSLVINFQSAYVYMKCHPTIYNNKYKYDEIQ